MGEIQFLTDKKFNYNNVMVAIQLPVLGSSQISMNDSSTMRLMDEALEKCKWKWKAECDGNVQTVPDNWPDITLKLKEKQIVTRIRFVPKHEDNGIQPGDNYSLSVWNGSEWQWLFTREAKYNFIHADGLQVGKMYWLRDRTKGQEELPFVIDENGRQHFVHEDLQRILRQ